MTQSQSPKEALKALVRRLSNAAFNAGHADAGDAWTRQEKTTAAAAQIINETLAAIDQLGVPAEGWVSVPIEPTGEMMIAALQDSRNQGSIEGNSGNALPIGYELFASAQVYRTMIAAAPKEPT